MSQLGLTYSVKEFLEKGTGIDVVIQFDGIVLPEEKPFIVVKQMPNSNAIMSKQRETVLTTYRFQVGIFARTLAERTATQDNVRDMFLFDVIPEYDDNGRKTTKVTQALITGETPLDADDVSDKTKTHRIYFDIEVLGTRHKNRGNK